MIRSKVNGTFRLAAQHYSRAPEDAASARRPTVEPELSKTDPQQVSWNVYDCAGEVGRWIGTVEAKSGQAAIRATAKQLGYQRHKLIAIMAASHGRGRYDRRARSSNDQGSAL